MWTFNFLWLCLGVGFGPQVGPFPLSAHYGLYKRGRDPPTNPSRHLKKERSELPLKWLLKEDQRRRPTAASAVAAAARRCAAAAYAAKTAASSCSLCAIPTRLNVPKPPPPPLPSQAAAAQDRCAARSLPITTTTPSLSLPPSCSVTQWVAFPSLPPREFPSSCWRFPLPFTQLSRTTIPTFPVIILPFPHVIYLHPLRGNATSRKCDLAETWNSCPIFPDFDHRPPPCTNSHPISPVIPTSRSPPHRSCQLAIPNFPPRNANPRSIHPPYCSTAIRHLTYRFRFRPPSTVIRPTNHSFPFPRTQHDGGSLPPHSIFYSRRYSHALPDPSALLAWSRIRAGRNPLWKTSRNPSFPLSPPLHNLPVAHTIPSSLLFSIFRTANCHLWSWRMTSIKITSKTSSRSPLPLYGFPCARLSPLIDIQAS